MIYKCPECGCLRVGDRRFHHKDCTIGLEYSRRQEAPPPELKVQMEGHTAGLQSEVLYHRRKAEEAEKEIGEWRDAVKLTCLDEVYECRLDCSTVPEGVWLTAIRVMSPWQKRSVQSAALRIQK